MSTAEERAAVLDSARYLRNVRPLDPEELAEYVEGGVHPAVVRQVLREEAVELGIVEREDGTFVPVPEEPHPGRGPLFEGTGGPGSVPGTGPGRAERPRIEGLPAAHARRVEDLLVGEFGRDWHRGESGDELRSQIRRLKEDYYRNRPVEYDRTAALGYAVYHLADYYAAVQYVLAELVADGLVDRRIRVLDVGAGVGGPALGLHDLLFGPPEGSDSPVPGEGDGTDGEDGEDGGPPTPPALVDYHAVEPSAAADVLETVLEGTDPNFHATVHRTTAEAFDPGDPLPGSERSGDGGSGDDGSGDAGADPGGYDLAIFANVLNELDDPTAVARRYLDHLAPQGAMVATAPADRETSIGLRSIERSLADGEGGEGNHATARATVYSPTVRLWPNRTPSDRCWSFDERPAIDPPAVQRKLDDAAGSTGEFTKTAVRYSYATLRVDGRERIRYVPDPERVAPMADAGDYVTERIDLVGVKLSPDLADPGRGDDGDGQRRAGESDGSGDHNPLFLVGDGSQQVDHYATLVRETSLNRALLGADYGDLLVFDGALALWNDDEEAYNLVVDEDTVVDRVPAGTA